MLNYINEIPFSEGKMKHYAILNAVRKYVEKNPDCAPLIQESISTGIRDALSESNNRATQMEIALMMAVQRITKTGKELIIQKLESLNGKTSLNWETTISELKASLEKGK